MLIRSLNIHQYVLLPRDCRKKKEGILLCSTNHWVYEVVVELTLETVAETGGDQQGP
jgi:hypothetical protein